MNATKREARAAAGPARDTITVTLAWSLAARVLLAAARGAIAAAAAALRAESLALALLAASISCIGAGVYMLCGLPWALLAVGTLIGLLGAAILRGLE